MASRSRRRAFSIPGTYLSVAWLCALLTLPPGGPALAGEAAAATAPVTGLRPYTATYRTSASGMDLTLTRQLRSSDDGSYTLTNGGKILVFGFHEVSVFRVEGTTVLPGTYVYQGSGLINRRREVHFAPGSDTIRSLYKDRWYDLPNSDKTLDRMSQQEQLRLLLLNAANPRRDLTLRVADGKRVKDYQLLFVGDEVLDTPLGEIPTLHFQRLHDDPERESDIWLAPGWDYLMVKTVHVEDDRPVEVMLTSASIDGVPVTAD
ncbi:MAG: DUF3108 domain-containing protein [Halioglobus sp.]|nr:DUF3108 domain-containing protein [Halioglobus sp.]